MQNKRNEYSWRRFNADVHLWLGIASAIVLIIVCLTGTILIFWEETIRFADADIYHVDQGKQKPLPVHQLIASLEGNNKNFKVSSVSIPKDRQEAWQISLLEIEKKGGENRRRRGRGGYKSFLVNQYTGQVQGDPETATSGFMMTTMYLHRFLLLDEFGRITVGVSTIIFIVLEISGLILWLPKKIKGWKSLKAGFSIKWDANWKRINHDLHNTLGFYSLILLLIMALTGLCWSFDWFRQSWNYVMHAELFSDRMEMPMQSAYDGKSVSLSADNYLNLSNQALPYDANVMMTLPTDSVGAVSITKVKTGFFASAAADRVVLDQYTGRILKLDLFSSKHLGQQITELVYPIHAGSVFGTFSKLIYFIACLIATSLPVTGAIIWINKLNKKRKNEKLPSSAQKAPSKPFNPKRTGVEVAQRSSLTRARNGVVNLSGEDHGKLK